MVIAFHTSNKRVNLGENIPKTLKILYDILKDSCHWFNEKYCTVWEGDPLDNMEKEDTFWPKGATQDSKLIISHGTSDLGNINLNTTIYIDPENILKDIPPIFITFSLPVNSKASLFETLQKHSNQLRKTAEIIWFKLCSLSIENARIIISENTDAILDFFIPRIYHAENNIKLFSKTLAGNIKSVFARNKPNSRKSSVPLEILVEESDENLLEERNQVSLEQFCLDLLTSPIEEIPLVEKYMQRSSNVEVAHGSIVISESKPNGIQKEMISLSRDLLKAYKVLYPPKERIIKKGTSMLLSNKKKN